MFLEFLEYHFHFNIDTFYFLNTVTQAVQSVAMSSRQR